MNDVFQPNDTPRWAGHASAMPRLMDSDDRGEEAFRRLTQLMQDMGWSPDTAKANLIKEIANPLKHTPNSVKNWFKNKSVPAHMIFNLAHVLGVSVTFIAGESEKIAPTKGGLYARERERLEMLERRFRAKPPTKKEKISS